MSNDNTSIIYFVGYSCVCVHYTAYVQVAAVAGGFVNL